MTGSYQAAMFQGLLEMNLQNVKLENALLQAEKGVTCIDTGGLELINAKIIPAKGSPLTFYNSKNVHVTDLAFEENGEIPVKVLGPLSEKIYLQKAVFSNPDKDIHKGKGINSKR